ncbi:MAG: hypothetical protein PWR10_1050 [Halanaerobiales bacterium]|nr:hypothetical protein [Halanaerobiales bacterium]
MIPAPAGAVRNIRGAAGDRGIGIYVSRKDKYRLALNVIVRSIEEKKEKNKQKQAIDIMEEGITKDMGSLRGYKK